MALWICPKCGSLYGQIFKCPKCKEDLQMVSLTGKKV